MFGQYFTGATYHAWDDLVPPHIEIAADGSQAWVVRRVCVDREEPEHRGVRRRANFVSAYTATYAKRDTAWVMTSVTSTFAPSASAACGTRGAA